MKNQVDMPPEYWAALSIGADLFGYFSRHEMVVAILKAWVDKHPSMLEKGKEKAALSGKAREVAMVDPRSLLVDIPNFNSALKEYRYRFWYRDTERGYIDSVGPYPLDAYMKFVGRVLSQAEFDEMFTRYEVLN